MNVRDLMEETVATLQSTDNLTLAEDVMRLGRIRHLPVLSGERVVGVVTQRDLFRAAISSVLRVRPSIERDWLLKIPVWEVMTSPVVTTTPDTTIRAALDIMLERRIGCLPVVDDERLVGLLTETACMKYVAHFLRLVEERADLPNLSGLD